MQYVISNAVFGIVIAKAEPEATEFTSSAKPIQKMSTTWIASRFVPRGRNDEHSIEVLFPEEAYLNSNFFLTNLNFCNNEKKYFKQDGNRTDDSDGCMHVLQKGQ
jgi:hypothetical protein